MTPSPNALSFRSTYPRCDLIATTHSRSPYFPQPYFQFQSDKLYNSRASQCTVRHEPGHLKVTGAVGTRFSIQSSEILCSKP